MAAKTDNLVHQHELMKVFDFNYRDLEANRAGWITAQQGKEIWNHGSSGCGFYFFAVIFTIIALSCLWSITIRETSLSYGSMINRDDWIISAIVFVLLFIAFLWNPSRNVYLLRKDISEREVWQIQGIATIQARGIKYLRINHLRFYLHFNYLRYFKDREPYVVYYLPRTKKIVSVEVMER